MTGLGMPIARPVSPALAVGRRRVGVVAACFTIAFVSIAARLVDMTMQRPGEPRVASAEPMPTHAPDPRRADIVDRNGELLATNMRVASIYADPAQVGDIDRAADELAAVLSGVTADELKRRLRAAKRFAWVKQESTAAEQAAVLRLGIPGVGFRATEKRVYPRGRLAAHAVGFVDIDNQGLAGLEHAAQAALVGGAQAGKAPLVTSLDLRVQQVVREELLRAHERFHTKGAVGIVLDRDTGELLSLVSLPDFDPNQARRASADSRKNRATGQTYELGSVFKVLSTAMALDSGKVALRDAFDATAPLRIGRHVIRDDHAKKRTLSVPEIFMYSSNIGTAKMVFAAGGGEALRGFFERAGMLAKPALELPELAKPQLPKRWVDITTATVAFGHGIAVTPLQFVDAVAALAGDGTRVAPTLLRRAPGEVPPRQRVIDARTAADIRWLMWLTVEKGTGTQVRDTGYLVGGKTGTADKFNPNGRGYLRGAVIASFIAVFPLEAPRYVVLVMLDEPRGDAGSRGLRYGGWTAAPVVREIISRIGPVLGVPPSTAIARAAFEDRLLTTQRAQPGQRKEERIAAVVARD
jgi:cell division protein FtsI (penicillin-binding protein 3)